MATNNVINTNNIIPSFQAYPSADILNVTGDGTLYSCVFNTTKFNINSNYSTATGIFTASVAGDYFFYGTIAGVQVAGLAACELFLVTTSSTYQLFQINSSTMVFPAANELICHGSMTVPLSAGDTAQLQFKVSGGGKVVDIVQGAATFLLSSWGGYLITPN